MSEGHFCEGVGGRLGYAASDCALCETEDDEDDV
jgi:hypothetical protein